MLKTWVVGKRMAWHPFLNCVRKKGNLQIGIKLIPSKEIFVKIMFLNEMLNDILYLLTYISYLNIFLSVLLNFSYLTNSCPECTYIIYMFHFVPFCSYLMNSVPSDEEYSLSSHFFLSKL